MSTLETYTHIHINRYQNSFMGIYGMYVAFHIYFIAGGGTGLKKSSIITKRRQHKEKYC